MVLCLQAQATLMFIFGATLDLETWAEPFKPRVDPKNLG